MPSVDIKTIYKKLVENYSNNYPSNPLKILNMHIEAYVAREWKTKESAILDLALRKGIEIPIVQELIKKGRERKEAIKEVSKNIKLQVAETEVEQWVKAVRKEQAREEVKISIYAKERMKQQIEDCEKSLEKLTTLFSKGGIGEESYKIAVRKIEKDIEDLRSGKEIYVARREMIEERKPSYYHESTEPSRLWYFVPILFSLLGGIVAYIGVRYEHACMQTIFLR